MKNTIANVLFHQHSSIAASPKKASGLLALTALLLCGLAASTVAQTAPISRTVPEKGFTIAPSVTTPIVLKTKPDAGCDLHLPGVSDKAHTVRYYANADGYVKIHARPGRPSEEGMRVQLDCTGLDGKVTRYPIHLRSSFAPTEDMPAPLTVRPTPKGSTVLRALTQAEILSLSNEELVTRGYSERPDAAASPDKYVNWLAQVSRPMTLIPPHLVSRSDISHHPQGGIEAGASADYAWSGYVANGSKRSYMAVGATWNVPEIVAIYPELDTTTYSSFWVGLDGSGSGTSDLVQAGTEQDAGNLFDPFTGWDVVFYNYSTWSEYLPSQTSEQDMGLSPNAGDTMQVEVWIGNGSGPPNANGAYGSFHIVDLTQNEGAKVYTPLSVYYVGATADWIMERTCVNQSNGTCNQFAELSDYNYAYMTYADVLTTKNNWINFGNTGDLVQLWLYNEGFNGSDNNLLSKSTKESATEIYFQWENFN
jgi:hypothetical protein